MTFAPGRSSWDDGRSCRSPGTIIDFIGREWNIWQMGIERSGEISRPGYGHSWAVAAEVDSFDQFVDDFHAGRIKPDDFKRFRLQHGIYGQRQHDVQMVRVKIPWGGLTAAQVDHLADVAERTPRLVGHVTQPRFGKPIARVPARQVPEAVKALLELY